MIKHKANLKRLYWYTYMHPSCVLHATHEFYLTLTQVSSSYVCNTYTRTCPESLACIVIRYIITFFTFSFSFCTVNIVRLFRTKGEVLLPTAHLLSLLSLKCSLQVIFMSTVGPFVEEGMICWYTVWPTVPFHSILFLKWIYGLHTLLGQAGIERLWEGRRLGHSLKVQSRH